MKHYYDAARWYDLFSVGIPGEGGFYLREAKKAKGKILELACGTGRIYLDLLEEGVDAYGLDLAAPMLDVLKNKAKVRGLSPKVKKADMRDFRYPFKFDLVIVPYRAFLHLERREDQKACLMNIHRHLKKGGRLIVNFFDPRLDFISKVERMSYSEVKDPKTGKRVRVENFSRYDFSSQHVYSYHRLVKPPSGLPSEKLELSLCYIFPREFMNMLELSGFKKWELFGGFDKRPYTKHGQELVWIATK
ncbi:MAG: methyltransferase domain-containing protein [Candidatus Micrarchaeota archaeon]